MTYPTLGSVWGNPADPSTWRRVIHIAPHGVDLASFIASPLYLTNAEFAAFVRAGAVDITKIVKGAE